MTQTSPLNYINWRRIKYAGEGTFLKLSPAKLIRKPIIFVLTVCALCATLLVILAIIEKQDFKQGLCFCFWLWATILVTNFSESFAEVSGKSQVDTLRKTQTAVIAKKVSSIRATSYKSVPAEELRPGDLCVVEAGETIPSDGDVVQGIATIDESSITGESAPVIRESGGDRCAVTGGTRVTSDRIVVEIHSQPGESFVDHMIGLVERDDHQKTPNESSLDVLLTGITFLLVIVCLTYQGFAFSNGHPVSLINLVALFAALIPITIGGLTSTISLSGMRRLMAHNIISKSSKAVESASDINTLLLDKTGTITMGNRTASAFIPVGDTTITELADIALVSSLDDTTLEGKSIVKLAEEQFGWNALKRDVYGMYFVPFTPQTRMSGVDFGDTSIRKGAPDAILMLSGNSGGTDILRAIEKVAKTGGTPLLVARNKVILGVIHLKDIIKPNIHQRFAILRQMGVRTVMITGDNPITAAAIAAEAGVDDFIAEATPEKKLEFIRREQALGKRIAMCGDGSNDAPALAQADIGVAMNNGAMAARQASNIVDLDNNPTKLIEIIVTGKKILMTRGALMIFSLFGDVIKYIALLPVLLAGIYPAVQVPNVLHLMSPQNALLSVLIYNFVSLVVLMPLALRGVTYFPAHDKSVTQLNFFICVLAGVVAPFIGIKLIDSIIAMAGA